jgi:hypothetical protein
LVTSLLWKSPLLWPKPSNLIEEFEVYQFDRSISPNWTDRRFGIKKFMIGLRMHRPIVTIVSSKTWFLRKSLQLWPKIPTLTEEFEFYQSDRSISPNWTDRRFGINIFTIRFRMHKSIIITISSATSFLWKSLLLWPKLSNTCL